jgi:SAM-dependent methyltransferase
MSFLGRLHGEYVHTRRVRVLRKCISELIPPQASVLDVGCGDGLLGQLIMDDRPDLQFIGIDVLLRKETRIPITEFDGAHIPFPDKSQDFVMFVDVLHHTLDPMVLLTEATRVARRGLLIKDHTLNGFLAGPTLRFMDTISNARFGVALPYNYWRHAQWLAAFRELGLSVESWNKNLNLYPGPADRIFGRSLHFIGRLDVGGKERRTFANI